MFQCHQIFGSAGSFSGIGTAFDFTELENLLYQFCVSEREKYQGFFFLIWLVLQLFGHRRLCVRGIKVDFTLTVQ